jgi:eukaryotic-like serine/threonine-protein kinase
MVLAASDCRLAGRYRLCRWLADGGIGQVWQAVDELLARPVAVKLLHDQYAEDPAFVGRFRAEARHAASVSHPGITRIFDYGEASTADGAAPTAFLVMELVEGESLSALLAHEGRLGLGPSLDIVGQAAMALGAAHRAGLVHRDVKPGNLLVRADGVVKVTDFGVSSPTGQEACDHGDAMLGTAGYLSPEQAAGWPVTPASDVYALGVVAYECLAGRPPFTGDHPIAVALAHLLKVPPPLPDDVPSAVGSLVGQAMAKEQRRRPTDAWSFGRQLLALRAGPGRVVRRCGGSAGRRPRSSSRAGTRRRPPPAWRGPRA